MPDLTLAMTGLLLRVLGRLDDPGRHHGTERERGDVPGWVLITIMTAGLVAALWLVAEPLLSDLFADAVGGVSGP